MYIFGGRSTTENIVEDVIKSEFYCNKIMYLNTENMKWYTPETIGRPPCGRRSHSSGKFFFSFLSVMFILYVMWITFYCYVFLCMCACLLSRLVFKFLIKTYELPCSLDFQCHLTNL